MASSQLKRGQYQAGVVILMIVNSQLTPNISYSVAATFSSTAECTEILNALLLPMMVTQSSENLTVQKCLPVQQLCRQAQQKPEFHV